MGAMTTIRVSVEVRDRLEAASAGFGAHSLGEALDRLLLEHEQRAILDAYAALRARPQEWADYLDELAEWDVVAADGLAGITE